MAQKIKALSEHTINQIAAGEVIENPASVVKELVENAIDAGALQITVAIAGGGHQLVRVCDDGGGMGREDALMCLERHATSKIEKADDLVVLSTMGFRGEALASIASVSKMRVLTAEENATGTEVEVEGGKVVHAGDAARARGTTIEVRSLFYNVPARKKFQKSVAISTADVTKVVTQQALAHPEVGFELIVQERSVFSVQRMVEGVDGISLRSAQLLGGHFETDVFKVDLKQGDCRLKGVIGSPLAHRHNRTGQYLFINRRPVVSPIISFAVRDAYGTRLASDRYPIFSLHLEIPSYLVDVNVHPQKKEVRLRDERGMKENIQTAVHLALQQAEGPSLGMQLCDEKLFVFEEEGTSAASIFSVDELPSSIFRDEGRAAVFEQQPPLADLGFHVIGTFSHYAMVDPSAPLFAALLPESVGRGGVVLVDLAAAQSQIAFDLLVRRRPERSARQGLLIPEVLSVSAEEEQLLLVYEEELAEIGFEMRQCGKFKFMIDAVPALIGSCDTLSAVREIMTELAEGQVGRLSREERLRKLAAAASRFAGGRKKQFMLQEAEEILKQLKQTSSPGFCPKGRLTMVYLSQDEIENKFFSADLK